VKLPFHITDALALCTPVKTALRFQFSVCCRILDDNVTDPVPFCVT
jgi:hypothetical protein